MTTFSQFLRTLDSRIQQALTHWAAVIPLLLVLTALAAPALGGAIWYDENRTLYYAGAPAYGDITLLEAVSRIAANHWQAPAYFLLLRGWGGAAGWDVALLRLPSLLFGLLTVAGTYHLARRTFSPQVGFYAVFTLSISLFYVHYLHEMRTYTLIAALVVALVWAYAWVTHGRQPLVVGYALLTLCAAGLVYTHYYTVFPLAGLGIYHLIFRFRKPRYVPTLICFAVAALLFLPWARVLLGGLGLATDDLRSVRNMSLTGAASSVTYMFGNGNRALVILLALLALPARDAARRFVWLWLIASFAVTIAVTRFFPMLTETRYLMFMWMPLGVLVGLGIHRLQTLGISPVMVLAVWALLAARSFTSPAERDLVHPWYTPPLHILADELRGRVGDDDTVLFHLPPNIRQTYDQTTLDYYLDPVGVPFARFIADQYATTDADYARRVLDAVEEPDAVRAWVTYETPVRHWRVGPVQETILPGVGFVPCGTVTENAHITMELFARPAADADPLRFGVPGGGEVRVYMLDAPTVRDGVLEINVGWDVPETVNAGVYSLGLHVVGGDEGLVGQVDVGLGGGFGCDYARVALPERGDYRVRAMVYEWQTGERLPARGDGERPVMAAVGW